MMQKLMNGSHDADGYKCINIIEHEMYSTLLQFKYFRNDYLTHLKWKNTI